MSSEPARSFDRTGDLHNLRPALVVVDEAHYAKNRNAGRSIAIESLARQSKQLLLMTGTPMENRLEEFASLLEFVSPTIASKIPTDPLQALSLSPKALRELVAPVYLRRNQEDVLTELPASIDSDEWLKPGKPEKAAYLRAVKERIFMGMRRSITMGDGSKSTSKMERLLEIIDESAEEGQRVIVFSFFTRVVETICGILPVVHGPITGRTPPYERQRIIDDFGSSPAPAVLVAQIQAGGTGLNIQAASVVVLMEPQIKPSLEEQAIARAHRMGQTRPVHVFRLLAAESVDERMVQMLARKRGDFESFARDSSIKEATAEAVEISDSAMANEIIRLERIRLGLDAAELPTSADDSSVVKSGRRNNPDDAGQTKLSY